MPKRTMDTIQRALEEGMEIDGAIAAALVDWDNGFTLGTLGGDHRLNIEAAAASNCAVVRAAMQTMDVLNLKGSFSDILITLDHQIHIIKPLRKYPDLFYYLAFDRSEGKLGFARLRIETIEGALVL
jgi:hypothetical protein